MTSISLYLGMHCSMHNFLGINKLVYEPYLNILTIDYSIYYSLSYLLNNVPSQAVYITYMRHHTGCAVNFGVPEAYL